MRTVQTVTSQAKVSESNRSRILHHLFRNGICSRAQISKALGLTPAAITKITARLLDAGIIEETGDIEGDKNRRSIGLRLDENLFHFIGVKFARSIVQIGVFNLAGLCLSLRDLPTVTNDTIVQTIQLVHTSVDALLGTDPRIIAVGMAVPGPYLRTVGRTVLVSSMRAWRTVNFLREFKSAFRVPVFIEQDARAGALANYLFDRSGSCSNLAYYLIGEGVGLGIIDSGTLINGTLGAATELGHISIDMHGRPCECGNVGCLERYCSAVVIHETIISRDLVPHAKELGHAEACNALFQLADAGDARARLLVEEVGQYAGFGCVTIINGYNPERIVIGDIVAQGGQRLLSAIREVVDEHVIPELRDSTTITLSALPSDAVICGAAAVAIIYFLDHPSMFFDVATASMSSNAPKR
ncbi:MAG: ROK family transcriptional regulator [Bifidobacterium tibiigranuli]|jgi:predicted NBD/HSP70 family sugar kinase/predicted transcriptional regulator|uniref:ROK family transcriptional regulator n=1 Tax=Bifidobacterium tibiigranuli TaxID=2172043 RepID=UPI0026E9F5E9|nr:ROK family transcriptional regulator [Bifidobacterium tibiigranuli]MCI1674104.1 ROK family transcriptional regulator [Bifidobacterium tibiigranuli]MCI1712843.1 ROK family transcriptional regulator [Bifidobacterium tibiigranuli]MCI1834184.1 ROK family transcriptional regulator [Bifidobacterium tibiigranuli]